MSDHAKLSPSKRHRWMLCPGSIREEAKYPEPPAGPAATDGTHTHSVLEYCIKNKLLDPITLVGTKMTDHEGEFTIDADRAARVKVAVEYIKSRVAEQNGLCEVMAEERVNPEWLLRRPDLFGTVDCQIWGPEVFEIIDYKDGMGIVDATNNPQLEQYAYGVLSRFKLTPLEEYPFKTLRMTIIQPKLALKGTPAITSHEVLVLDLLRDMWKIGEQAGATEDPNAPLVPGESQCKFCRAKGGCAALAGNVMKEVGLMFQPVESKIDLSGGTVPGGSFGIPLTAADVPNPRIDLAHQSADKDPTTMTDDQIRQILEAAPLVRQLIEGVEAEALRRLQAGKPVPGFKLVRGRGSRAWALPEDEMAQKLIKMGIPKTAVYETTLVSPAKAEKLVWEKRDGSKVQLSEKQIQKMNQEYVAANGGKLTIAPESDPREAVITDAAAMFGAVQPSIPVTFSDYKYNAVEAAQQEAPTLPSWLC